LRTEHEDSQENKRQHITIVIKVRCMLKIDYSLYCVSLCRFTSVG